MTTPLKVTSGEAKRLARNLKKSEAAITSEGMKKTKVIRASQSPMNKLQWLCELECGHEVWVTHRGKPKAVTCPECVKRIGAKK